jgi:thioesterase domain-containing protein
MDSMSSIEKNSDLASNLQAYLHDHIPISKALGIEVVKASADSVVLSAPLTPNINHKHTVFGGSLHSAATLACWGLVYVNLEVPAEIVIASSEVKYLAPVYTDFTVNCQMEDRTEYSRFQGMLQKKGKARIRLSAWVYQDDKIAVEYFGDFVSIKRQS